MTIERVKLSELVEDLNIYPRGSVSDVRVDDMVYALDAGKALPPPIADHTTRKIVDGFHRTRAYRKRLGDDGTIDVDVQDFPDDAAMLRESVRINAPQGLPLGRNDQRWVVIRARNLGISDEDIAEDLGVTQTRLLQIVIRQAQSDAGPIPTKSGVAHLSGSYLTAEQVTEIRRMRGAPARTKISELSRLLKSGLVPVQSDPDLREDLATLAAIIEAVLAPYAAE